MKQQQESLVFNIEKEHELKMKDIKRTYEGELLKRDNEINRLKTQINLPPSKIEVIESSIPRNSNKEFSSPSINPRNTSGNWTVVNSPTRKRGKTTTPVYSSPKSGESTASFWGPSALFLHNSNSNTLKKGRRNKKMQ